MRNREKVDYINTQLDVKDLLLALAEEASEVSQAALKLHRALDGKNPTPVSPSEAKLRLAEEMGDVMLCWNVMAQHGRDKDDIPSWENNLSELQNQKLDRWVKRLKEAEGHDED